MHVWGRSPDTHYFRDLLHDLAAYLGISSLVTSDQKGIDLNACLLLEMRWLMALCVSVMLGLAGAVMSA
jgi:hypothetical protein